MLLAVGFQPLISVLGVSGISLFITSRQLSCRRGLVTPSRIQGGLSTLSLLDARERIHHLGVELQAAFLLDLSESLSKRPSALVAAGVDEGIKDVGYGHDAGCIAARKL